MAATEAAEEVGVETTDERDVIEMTTDIDTREVTIIEDVRDLQKMIAITGPATAVVLAEMTLKDVSETRSQSALRVPKARGLRPQNRSLLRMSVIGELSSYNSSPLVCAQKN